MLALHVAHSSPLSTAKQIWYVMMSVFDLGGPDGLPKYFHLRFFHCLIHSHTALAGIQELIWTSSVVLTIGAVTKVVILFLVFQLLYGLQHRCCRSLSFGLCGQLLIPNICGFKITVIFFRFHQQPAGYFLLYHHLRYGTGSLLQCNLFHLLKGLSLFNFDFVHGSLKLGVILSCYSLVLWGQLKAIS